MTQAARSLKSTVLRSAMLGFAATLVVATGISLNAQAIAGHNSDAPVNYAADRLELQDRQNRVVLAGNVVINQAALTLRAGRTVVNYSDTGNLSIQRITATGDVTVTRGNERASGEVAVYDFNRRIITMAGNVRLVRGGDTLNGGRLTIDLRTGVSSVDGSASGSSPVTGGATVSGGNGRVSGSFTVPD